ncbi:MAG: alpha-glucan family phosphorylase [Betaproteobacteria bacterium]|nr:alpha-glucan family phosphorylase [Betaproteobacteria bacterium]
MQELPGTRHTIEISPRLPRSIARLEELAENLRYSWDRATRAVFSRLHPALWDAIGHSPKTMLKCVDEDLLNAAGNDAAFMHGYARALAAYDAYFADRSPRDGAAHMPGDGPVAYFCAEFGFHESLPIYSGGLGILAGDHCKTASDIRLPFVGVGLLYRQGYFSQSIDAAGQQHPAYHDSQFDSLPIAPALAADGDELRVEVALPGRRVQARVWYARVGHVRLYLLDTDVSGNSEHDRAITFRLYGGGSNTRIEQEMLLGIGGVRALRALGIAPAVWHINEGHAAFLVLERAREIARTGAGFDAALEAVAANTVFTTHTAVAAGHDHFPAAVVAEHFESYCREIDLPFERLLALGRTSDGGDFNMTSLAIRGSRQQNGVSRIHARVSAELLRDLWPQIPLAESPLAHVTNGIHVPTFLAPEWHETFDRVVGAGWEKDLEREDWAARIESIPDEQFWGLRQHLKSQLLHLVRYRVREQNARNRVSEAHVDRVLRHIDPTHPDVLVIGFGRRFATYKRATLLFSNLAVLREIVSDVARPVIFMFAGKAHPADTPGQELIRRIAEISRMREFEGKVLLVEGYDLRLSRRMVSGVDVWLNNPVYPLEASGTSGMKAAINGVVNLSVLDGWWDEGYDGMNGWAIKPAALHHDPQRSDYEESRTLYEILQDQVIPLYYGGDERVRLGYSPGWIRLAKRSMATILPRFNTQRMLREYIDRHYVRAAEQGRRYATDGHALAREVAAWKTRVRAAWPGVSARRVDTPPTRARFGDAIEFEVAVRLNGLAPGDVALELVLSRDYGAHLPAERRTCRFAAGESDAAGETRYRLRLAPDLCGPLEYRLRMLPHHPALTHPFELGLMVWI